MARAAFNLRTQILDIVCHDEADGWGDAEPYLWPVFFKIDGDSYAVDAAGLIGFPKVFSTNGNHGNLGDTDVGDGDRVSVPLTLGTHNTLLKPIPVLDPIRREIVGDDLPGIAGLVVVLMEQDGWPNELAVAGYNAFVNAVQLGVAKAMASFQNAVAEPSEDEIDAQIAQVETLVEKMVKGAVLEAMSGLQIAGFGTVRNNDDQIGTETFRVTQDDFANGNRKAFERRWSGTETGGDGDWSIRVAFTNLDAPRPPADPVQCEKIATELASLQESLEGEDDINEVKRIRKRIADLEARSKQLGCPRVIL
ncbi:MAG TPA: hypothetical protein VF544_02780 [Pyrinomonadaceae bacterium]|jgi:hypothetical protein